MNTIRVFLICLLLIGCARKITEPTLYQTDVVTIESPLSYDAAWDKLIDFIATKGVSVKLLDKSSGLMTTDTYSLINSYTFQNKNGGYYNLNAYVVLGKIKPGLIALKPSIVEGSWNIRIKKNDDKIFINVNLVSLKAYTVIRDKYSSHTYNFPIKSTGNFEKNISNILK